MRVTDHPAAMAAMLILALLLTGCAAQRAPSATPVAKASGRDSDATIVAVRPVGGNAAAVLSALRAPAGPGEAGVASEFILRVDTGRTVAIVQSNPDGLRTGDRVRLAGESRARLQRLATAASPAS